MPNITSRVPVAAKTPTNTEDHDGTLPDNVADGAFWGSRRVRLALKVVGANIATASILGAVTVCLLIVPSFYVWFPVALFIYWNPSCGDKFDDTVAELEAQIRSGAMGHSSVNTPLLDVPERRQYRLEDHQFEISRKKSGVVCVEGGTGCFLWLLQIEKTEDNGLAVIRGSRVPVYALEGGIKQEGELYASHIVEKGLICVATRKAYILECNPSSGIKRVVSGTFDSNYEVFKGEWLSSDGFRGCVQSLD